MSCKASRGDLEKKGGKSRGMNEKPSSDNTTEEDHHDKKTRSSSIEISYQKGKGWGNGRTRKLFPEKDLNRPWRGGRVTN